MLQITADVFSGRPNPVWIISDENEAKTILRGIMQDRALVTDSAPPDAGLGFRGVVIESLSDELPQDFDLPPQLYIPAGQYAKSSKGNEIAERLIGMMTRAVPGTEATADSLPLDETLQKFLVEQLTLGSRVSVQDGRGSSTEAEPAEEKTSEEASIDAAVTCTIELAAYNPGFWNNNSTIRSRNNCYNYASNKRTDTFAQPGRGSGHKYTALTCAAVTTASLYDGLHRRYHCFPTSEAPRYLVALVVAPGVDFHWYRKMKEGFWGHKPGGTAVRNTDNSGKLILDPATCNRGIYTHFCGYFYTCKSQKIN